MATVAETMVNTLKDLGVRYVFGVPSGNWIDYMSAMQAVDGLDFVLAASETSGGFMADVCWRLTGKVAACFGTFGPGACNLSTGVCGGYLDRAPMLAFTDNFLMEHMWALLIVLFFFAFLIAEGMGMLERKFEYYAASRNT